MSIRTLFALVVKIIGLLALKDALNMFPPTLLGIFQAVGTDDSAGALALIAAAVAVVCYGLVPAIFLFRAHWLVDTLGLSQGFEQEVVTLAAHRSTILSVAIFIVGGWLVASELPNLGRQLLTYSQERRSGQINPELSHLLLTISKIAIGLLLIAKQRQLVNLIEYQRQH